MQGCFSSNSQLERIKFVRFGPGSVGGATNRLRAFFGIPKRQKVRFKGGMQNLDPIFASLRQQFNAFPDNRKGSRLDSRYEISDSGMAAFSVFFMQSPSFLSHQKQLEKGHGRSNCATLFGIKRIPCDTTIRSMLDPADPKLLFPVFNTVLAEVERTDGLQPFRCLGGHVLVALDGTEFFNSYKINCEHCSTRERINGKKECFHSMLAVTIVAPGNNKIIPLQPEFISPQDGAAKQDSEIAAGKRWLKSYGTSYARLRPIYLGDDLFAHQPFCKEVIESGGDFIFTCKPATHTLIEEYVDCVELDTCEAKFKHGKAHHTYCYKWLNDVPLKDDKSALKVNWFEIEIRNTAGKVTYHNSYITNLQINKENIVELAACARARWKIENEAFNVLKTKGYNLEHNFGHGKEHLSSILVTLNLLAFMIHSACDLYNDLWKRVRDKLATRQRFFNNLIALTSYHIFTTWTELLLTLGFEMPPPHPP
jgi:hypothetical protein